MLMAVLPDASALPMTALTVPFLVIGITLTSPAYVFGVRRLLGLRLPLLRTMAVLVLGLRSGPHVTSSITLYQVLG